MKEKCIYWLAERHEDGKISLLDGCHSCEYEVSRALHLMERLNCIKTGGRDFIMVTVEGVESFDNYSVCAESIQTLNSITPKKP